MFFFFHVLSFTLEKSSRYLTVNSELFVTVQKTTRMILSKRTKWGNLGKISSDFIVFKQIEEKILSDFIVFKQINPLKSHVLENSLFLMLLNMFFGRISSTSTEVIRYHHLDHFGWSLEYMKFGMLKCNCLKLIVHNLIDNETFSVKFEGGIFRQKVKKFSVKRSI